MKWEYEIMQIEGNEDLNNLTKLKDEFNKYGSEGWEVVEIIRRRPIGTGWLSNTEKNFVLLKRACN